MGKIIAIANQKGGVGKTTTAVNICAALANRGRKVLLIDCDPQGNATTGMGIKKGKVKGIYDVLLRDVPAKDALIATKYGTVLPAQAELAAANIELVEIEGREQLLKKRQRNGYKLIINSSISSSIRGYSSIS